MSRAFGLIGFTGTRKGMTQAQRKRLAMIFQAAEGIIHGDCVGADAQAHIIARTLGLELLMRPCDITSHRAFSEQGKVVADPAPPLERNKLIVDDCDVLIACPDGPERRRSGTWSTVRYARQLKKPGLIIMPDGTMQAIGD